VVAVSFNAKKQESRRKNDRQREGVAESIAAPVRIPPGDEDAHDAEAAAYADQRGDLRRIESGTGNQHGGCRQKQAVARAITQEAD